MPIPLISDALAAPMAGATGAPSAATSSLFSRLLGGVGDLFKNKLLLQGLAAAGSRLSGEGSVGEALNGVAMQNISAQNYSKLLSKILGEGGKMTVDKDKFNVSGPSSILSGNGKGQGQTTETTQGVQQNPFLPALQLPKM